MQDFKEFVIDLGSTDYYITKNPSIYAEHSAWKIGKIIEVLDKHIHCFQKKINLLDVGGGAGLILKSIAVHLEASHNLQVKRFALDMSPEMIAIQKARDPKIEKGLVEDIRNTSLKDKEIDLVLAIDLLEHVPNPTKALKEIRRISKFVILKVPLEDNLYLKIKDILTKGNVKKYLFEQYGHINFYNHNKLEREIEKYMGEILYCGFTNAFSVRLKPEHINNLRARGRLVNYLALYLYKVSPKFCSYIFNDFVMFFVKCYEK